MSFTMEFPSVEAARAAAEEAMRQANANLHDEQRALTWGSHWIRFVDLKRRHVVFGRVYEERVALSVEIEAGCTEAEADMALDVIRRRQEENWLFGRSFDRFSPGHEEVVGGGLEVHRFDVWPIEERLYQHALSADGDVEQMDTWAQVLVNIAHVQWRAWRAEVRGRIEGSL